MAGTRTVDPDYGLTSTAPSTTTKQRRPAEENQSPQYRVAAWSGEGGTRHSKGFFQELADPLKNVVVTAWASRGKLAQDVKSYVYVTTATIVSMPGRVSKVVHNPKIHAVLLEEEDPEALAAVVSGTGAALCLGSIGVVVGSSLGGISGLVLGIPLVFFTLGLSVPVGVVIGSMSGLCGGLALGSSVGFVGGAASGCFIAHYRIEIRNTANGLVARVDYAYDKLVRQPTLKMKSATRSICDKTSKATAYTKEGVASLMSSRHAQVTAAGAAAGATALGTAGATGGLVAGGVSGAALGVPLALFTFGLSIPAGAVVGGGIGLCTGAAAGGATGLVGGGAAGYAGYRFRSGPKKAYTLAREKWGAFRNGEMRNRSSSGGTEDTSASD